MSSPSPSPSPSELLLKSKYDAIEEENKKIKKEIDLLNDSTTLNARLNTYYSEDRAFSIYLNRVLLIAYIIVYVFLLLTLYLNRATMPIISIVAMVVVFFAFPFFIDSFSKYAYSQFLNIMHLFYKGNSFYLYKPPEKTDTL
jgi:hypothetical protein